MRIVFVIALIAAPSLAEAAVTPGQKPSATFSIKAVTPLDAAPQEEVSKAPLPAPATVAQIPAAAPEEGMASDQLQHDNEAAAIGLHVQRREPDPDGEGVPVEFHHDLRISTRTVPGIVPTIEQPPEVDLPVPDFKVQPSHKVIAFPIGMRPAPVEAAASPIPSPQPFHAPAIAVDQIAAAPRVPQPVPALPAPAGERITMAPVPVTAPLPIQASSAQAGQVAVPPISPPPLFQAPSVAVDQIAMAPIPLTAPVQIQVPVQTAPKAIIYWNQPAADTAPSPQPSFPFAADVIADSAAAQAFPPAAPPMMAEMAPVPSLPLAAAPSQTVTVIRPAPAPSYAPVAVAQARPAPLYYPYPTLPLAERPLVTLPRAMIAPRELAAYGAPAIYPFGAYRPHLQRAHAPGYRALRAAQARYQKAARLDLARR